MWSFQFFWKLESCSNGGFAEQSTDRMNGRRETQTNKEKKFMEISLKTTLTQPNLHFALLQQWKKRSVNTHGTRFAFIEYMDNVYERACMHEYDDNDLCGSEYPCS